MPASKTRTRPGRLRRWVLRAALALIFVVNVQCALSFVLNPAAFADAYELTGAVGAAAVQGLGVTFLMWNATYPPVIAHPERHRTLFGVIVAQQAIGLVGESLILTQLPAGHTVLAAGIVRFIGFDAFALVLMVAAGAFCYHSGRKT